MANQIDDDRWAKVQSIGLRRGAHSSINDGLCAMEAAAYISGEAWSDHPECVCPVIGAFMRSWNDSLNTEDRNKLILPLIRKTVGTRGSAALAERRSLMAADWLVRVHTPAWLRVAKLDAQADLLTGLPEITAMAQVPSIRAPLEAVRKDAAAAWDAALAAARDAARDAAWAAALAAALAAARAAAWDAALAAALAAARDAAWDALKPTRDRLQHGAGELIERMCALTDADLRVAA